MYVTGLADIVVFLPINHSEHKKVFQSNANCLLSDSPSFIVNKFEHEGGRSLYSEVQVEQV